MDMLFPPGTPSRIPIAAVTGTNGKTTTTEWIGHIHRQAGSPAAVAGNVGTAVSSLVGKVGPERTIVCEVSSFQLEDTEAFAPEAAVLINLSPDHLDRHESFEAYVRAKLRIFQNQTGEDIAVVPETLRTFLGQLAVVPSRWRAQQIEFGQGPRAALREHDKQLWWCGEPLASVQDVSLPGTHNLQNAMAAASACLARGLEADAVVAGLKSFPGVAHRLELVAKRDGICYVNDSKATNVQSTLVALAAYEGGVHLIAGGRSKQQDFTPLAPLVAERCRAVYLIGEAEHELAAALERTAVPLRVAGDLERALHAARAAASPGDVVLLSPACASYDAYRNFEARGEHFRALVEAG
jgi:UDP-N-acetylmuramoylalanine--D-glutamate ligase